MVRALTRLAGTFCSMFIWWPYALAIFVPLVFIRSTDEPNHGKLSALEVRSNSLRFIAEYGCTIGALLAVYHFPLIGGEKMHFVAWVLAVACVAETVSSIRRLLS